MIVRRGTARTWILVVLLVITIGAATAYWRSPDVARQQADPGSELRRTPLGTEVIETEALPLRLSIDRVSQRIDMKVGGGAIELMNDKLLVMDRMGKIFIYADKQIVDGGFPELPMHMKEFRESGAFPVTQGTLRAHDLKYDDKEQYLYVSYDSWDKAAAAPRFVISRIAVPPGLAPAKSGWSLVWESTPVPRTGYYAGRSAGGKLLIKGRNLYFAVGDYSLDRIFFSPADIAAQNIASPFGKIYRYDVNTKSTTVVSIGHRVTLGLAMTSTGQLLESENGPRGGDELNRIVERHNYGWPYVSYGTHYFGYRSYLDAAGFHAKTTDPVFAWVPSVALTSVFESHHFAPEWNGNIILGSLKAQSLFRLKWSGGRVVFSEPIWIGHRIRDALEEEGRIVIWTDDGALIYVTPDRELLNENRLNVERGYGSNALAACSTCHSFASHNQFYWAPTLRGIYGSRIAGDSFQNYSPALKNKSGVWNEGTLTAFLLDPQSFCPGTTMIDPDLTPAQVVDIVRELKDLSR